MDQREKSKILEIETGKKHGILNSFLLRNGLSEDSVNGEQLLSVEHKSENVSLPEEHLKT